MIKKIGPRNTLILFATLIVLVSSFFVIILKHSTENKIILYSNLDIEDSNKIITELEQKNIQYDLRSNGTEILVAEEHVVKLRMQLAQNGLPGKGNIVGYEIFDKSDSITTSNFVQNIHLQRALEGELARSISTFKKISTARVHLVIPKRELFSRDYQKPSASVILDMANNNALTKEEAHAISHLVATAVPGLEQNKVTIVDTRGRSLKFGDENDELFSYSSSNNEFRINFEKKVKKSIESLLERTIGIGKVEAQVSAELNFDRIVTNSEIYDPEGQVIRSSQTISEADSNQEGLNTGDSSVANNLPNGAGVDQENTVSNNSQKTDETINYEVSKTIKNHISEVGNVKQLSIAVLIDGKYKKDKDTGEMIYIPRTEIEIEQIKKLIKSAVGFDETRNDKLEIVNMQFHTIEENISAGDETETIMTWFKKQLDNKISDLIKSSLLVIASLLGLLLFVKPFINKIFDAMVAKSNEDSAQLNVSSNEEQTQKLDNQVSQAELQKAQISPQKNKTFDSINDIAKQLPQETVMTIRNWLNNK